MSNLDTMRNPLERLHFGRKLPYSLAARANFETFRQMDEIRRRRRKSHAPTMIDVAEAAGVSIATVSAFLNGTSNVSPDLTQRIEIAIRDDRL